jgi:hypothetical protein
MFAESRPQAAVHKDDTSRMQRRISSGLCVEKQISRTSPFFPLESDHNSGIFKEVERSTIAITNKHKVYTRASHSHQRGHIIEAAIFDILCWHFP